MKKKLTICCLLLAAIPASLVLTSCNVTRTINYQRGDTSVVIQTKTIETYDASKK